MTAATTPQEPISNRDQVILHYEYHPDYILREQIRDAYWNDGGLGIDRAIVAYSRPWNLNLKDMLQKAKLYSSIPSGVTN